MYEWYGKEASEVARASITVKAVSLERSLNLKKGPLCKALFHAGICILLCVSLCADVYLWTRFLVSIVRTEQYFVLTIFQQPMSLHSSQLDFCYVAQCEYIAQEGKSPTPCRPKTVAGLFEPTGGLVYKVETETKPNPSTSHMFVIANVEGNPSNIFNPIEKGCTFVTEKMAQEEPTMFHGWLAEKKPVGGATKPQDIPQKSNLSLSKHIHPRHPKTWSQTPSHEKKTHNRAFRPTLRHKFMEVAAQGRRKRQTQNRPDFFGHPGRFTSDLLPPSSGLFRYVLSHTIWVYYTRTAA